MFFVSKMCAMLLWLTDLYVTDLRDRIVCDKVLRANVVHDGTAYENVACDRKEENSPC